MVDEAARRLGGIDVLVNNAGIWEAHPITDTTYEEWQPRVAAHAGHQPRRGRQRHLVARSGTWSPRGKGGAIVNVASRGAFRGEPEHPAYGASKAGLIAFGQSLARALGPHEIIVSAVAPGFVDTDMAAAELAGEQGVARRAESPLGRVSTPEDIAAAVVFLASPEAKMASGSVLDVNGASYLRM